MDRYIEIDRQADKQIADRNIDRYQIQTHNLDLDFFSQSIQKNKQ